VLIILDQVESVVKRQLPIPRNCTFSPQDWTVLAQYWYPIARADEVSDKPLAVKLLDVELVTYRANGKLVVARDLCVHRGTPLSMGWVEGDEIVCPYHGFHYAPDGKCTSIPAHPGAKISPKLCLTVFPAVERYGLIWTTLSGTEENLPPFPVWDDDEFQNILPPTLDINGNAGRQIEGFLDVAHFAWVHANSFADRDNSFVPSYKVEVTDYGLHAEYISTVSNYTKENRRKEPPGFKWLRVFDVYPPLAARLIIYFPNGGTQWILNVPCPISARKTRLFSPMARNFDKDAPLESFYELNLQIFTEDAEMVENQKPEELPIDLTSEAHIAADKTSINYRKFLMQLGMGENYTN